MGDNSKKLIKHNFGGCQVIFKEANKYENEKPPYRQSKTSIETDATANHKTKKTLPWEIMKH